MKSNKTLSRLALAALLASATAPVALAVPLPINPTTQYVEPLIPDTGFTGTEVGSPLVLDFTATKESGSIVELVYRQTDGDLNFYYQITNNAGSTDSLSRFTATDFSGFTTSVSYVTGTGTNAPDYADDLQSNGDSIGFQFQAPGPEWEMQSSRTRAQTFWK